ncbi:2-dehydro-3-deoxyphosphogluconate aldolase/4-hydroxy-2-oxoglutarate aldolase [Tolypothrix sp. NIES-4075]|nr:2-dehydro-3-deoxyphosphogluconate aldolase/4-hydroxy-2-oxoglutarate aldolase [Tolypothrix sp. NIES-4075]
MTHSDRIRFALLNLNWDVKWLRAIASGRMRLIEITWNSDRAAELIAQLRLELPECIIGTGTLLNFNHMEEAITSKAQFLLTPHSIVNYFL